MKSQGLDWQLRRISYRRAGGGNQRKRCGKRGGLERKPRLRAIRHRTLVGLLDRPLVHNLKYGCQRKLQGCLINSQRRRLADLLASIFFRRDLWAGQLLCPPHVRCSGVEIQKLTSPGTRANMRVIDPSLGVIDLFLKRSARFL